ncbi:surface exclusion protein [Escherichia coli]|nr:surface exclusion protein [Escherichia coli]
MIQFIACYLADWGECRNSFLSCALLYYGRDCLYGYFLKYEKKRHVSDEFKFSKGVWYILMPVSSLLSPLLSLMVFIIGTLYELRRISGCVSVREWMQSQVNEQTNEDLHLDFDDVNFDYVDFLSY